MQSHAGLLPNFRLLLPSEEPSGRGLAIYSELHNSPPMSTTFENRSTSLLILCHQAEEPLSFAKSTRIRRYDDAFPSMLAELKKKRFCSFFDSMIPRIFLSQINPAFEVNISAGLSTVLSVMNLLKRIHHPVKHHPHREMPHLLINAWKTSFAPTQRLHHSPGNFDKLSTRECF